MIFWFGGILGALLVAVGLFMLIQRVKTAGWVLLWGLILTALLVPALGLFRETQTYLIAGLVGVGLLVLGIFLAPRIRNWGPVVIGLGLALGSFLLPYFNLTQPWNTNPMALISGTPTTPAMGIQPSEPAPLTDPNATATAPTSPTVPEQSPLPSEPQTTPQAPVDPNSTATQTPTDPNQNSVPTEPQPALPSPTQPTNPTAAQPTPNQPVGAVENNQLCPCVLRVSSGISDATVVLSKDGREISRQSGAQVVFSNLELGSYTLMVGALGHQTFQTPLQINNNKDLTVYLLRQ